MTFPFVIFYGIIKSSSSCSHPHHASDSGWRLWKFVRTQFSHDTNHTPSKLAWRCSSSSPSPPSSLGVSMSLVSAQESHAPLSTKGTWDWWIPRKIGGYRWVQLQNCRMDHFIHSYREESVATYSMQIRSIYIFFYNKVDNSKEKNQKPTKCCSVADSNNES